jgi:hypothetical protein
MASITLTTTNTNGNSSSTTDLSEACAVRAYTMLNNVPPTRYTPTNPYPQYSQIQLDMRRKIEIFKYAGKDHQQTNSMTKNHKWSLLANNAARGTNRSSQYYCAMDRLLPTLSSACDIPGPIITLTYDPNVILYNYVSQINSQTFPDADISNNA